MDPHSAELLRFYLSGAVDPFGSKCSDYRYFYSDPVHEGKKYDKLLFFYNSNKKEVRHFVKIFQCCGAGAGGAEIILGPRAGAKNKF